MVVTSASAAPESPWWTFLSSPRPDPRVLQSVFAIFVALDVMARDFAGHGYAALSWPALGLLLVAAGTAFGFLVPWQRVPVTLLAVLPVLDVAALGLTRLSPEGGGSSVLVVMPAVWLARQFGRAGVTMAIVAVALLDVGPGLLYLGVDGALASRAVLQPLVAGLAALAVAMSLELLLARTHEVEERGEELERTLAEMGRQKHLNQAVLDTVDVGLVLLGPDGSYQTLNRRQQVFMELAFPGGHEGVAGQLGEVYSEDGTTRLAGEEMPSARAMRGEEFEDYRVWIGPDPDRRRAISVSAQTLRGAGGAFAGAALAYKDVTDLLSALQVKEEFVATVSHELRTPLTSIIGYVDLLREEGELDDRAEKQLVVVHRNGQRLLRLVDDLLHTAQLADGQQELSLRPCELADLVREAVAAVQPAAARAGVALSTSLIERMPVHLDSERIGQVLDNLLSNAVRYNRHGGSVSVVLARDGETALLEVRDDGPGMGPEELEQLFTHFYRARHAVDHAIPGAGLGLCISEAIVDAHGGTIEIHSEVDVGTVARVRLPVLAPLSIAPRAGDAVAEPADPACAPPGPPAASVRHG